MYSYYPGANAWSSKAVAFSSSRKGNQNLPFAAVVFIFPPLKGDKGGWPCVSLVISKNPS